VVEMGHRALLFQFNYGEIRRWTREVGWTMWSLFQFDYGEIRRSWTSGLYSFSHAFQFDYSEIRSILEKTAWFLKSFSSTMMKSEGIRGMQQRSEEVPWCSNSTMVKSEESEFVREATRRYRSNSTMVKSEVNE